MTDELCSLPPSRGGDDRLIGPNNDSGVDTVSGGDGNDVCTGPGLDFDIVSGCEIQTP